MPEDRSEMEAARLAGLARRHETREARAIRRAVAEEIAEAIEAAFSTPRTISEALRLSPRDYYITQAVAIAREIGSRDPA